MNRLVVPASVCLVGAACVDEEQPRLLVPDGIEVAWEEAYNLDGDGLGALVPVDVMAYDGASGEPLAGVELLVWTEGEGAWPVPTEGVWLADPDEESAFWDAARDQFVMLELGDDPLTLVTDASGLARSYIYVDTFELGSPGSTGNDDGFVPTSAVVAFGPEAGEPTSGVAPGENVLLHPW
jgi:hypothetical protein